MPAPRHIALRLADKFSIDRQTGCWVWTAGRSPFGYGKVGGRVAHKIVWELVNARPVADGLQLDHLCRVPSCVNPNHLEEVTGSENCKRGANGVLRVRPTHCPQGHEFNEENTGIYRSDLQKGHRFCRSCRRESWRAKHGKGTWSL